MHSMYTHRRVSILAAAISLVFLVSTFVEAKAPAAEPEPVVTIAVTVPPTSSTSTTSTTSTTTTTTTTTTTVSPVVESYDWQCPQWIDLAVQVGFRKDELKVVDRILWKESRCQPDVHNPSDPHGGSYGLVQINGYWCESNEYNPIGFMQAQGILTTCTDLYNPVINLTAALIIRERQGDYAAWGI